MSDEKGIVVSQTSHLLYKQMFELRQAELAATNHVMTTRGPSTDVRLGPLIMPVKVGYRFRPIWGLVGGPKHLSVTVTSVPSQGYLDEIRCCPQKGA